MKLELDRSVNPDSETRKVAIERATRFLLGEQEEPGFWDGRYDGPEFLVPSYVIVMEAGGFPIEERVRSGMLRYLRSRVREDGGWGLHVEDEDSRVFPTVLCYVAARLLGMDADDSIASRAREWMESEGDATQSAPWGKFLLALIGLYDYRGVLPVPPELWIIPRWLPIHPSRLWCHSRMVYLPMSYLYGRRDSVEMTPFLRGLRSEIFADDPEKQQDWSTRALEFSPRDTFYPLSSWMRWAGKFLFAWEKVCPRRLRRQALRFVAEQVRREDENTSYVCLGPLNQVLNLLVRLHEEGPESEAVRRHLDAIPGYFCEDENGIRWNGYKNSRVWDTAFAVQAIEASGQVGFEIDSRIRSATEFLVRQQIREENPGRDAGFRGRIRGGFPFCDSPHGWPVTDSTAEALVAVIMGRERDGEVPEAEGVRDAASRLLEWQNPDGGWGTFERVRGPRFLEHFDPSRVFADTMIEYSYPECTSACFRALLKARPYLEPSQALQVDRAVARGRQFLRERQKEDGSWRGSWGICFTYGTWFGVWGLRAAGVPEHDSALRQARAYLEEIQLSDGGWGERAESCRRDETVPTEEGQAVMTAWALLALSRCGGKGGDAMERGIHFLESRQLPDGSWPEEHISGVFNRTCAIHYDNYRKVFPLWALAECLQE